MLLIPFSRQLPRATTRSWVQWVCTTCSRSYSATVEAPTPPMLSRLRDDLKKAMRAKDTSRLNVLKGVLAEVTNASKTKTPIQNDMQLLSLLRKRITAADAAKTQFQKAGREDLLQNEEQQVAVLEEYASGVSLMSLEEVRQAVVNTVLELRASDSGVRAGNVMKALFASGGRLDGKSLDKSTVPGLVKEALISG